MKNFKPQKTNVKINPKSEIPVSKFGILMLVIGICFGFWSLMFDVSAEASLDPMQLGVGARSLAMGRTSVAIDGDINSMFVNPANAANLYDWGLTSMYTSLLEGDIAYTLLGYGKKLPMATMGLSYMGSGVSGIATTQRDANNRIVSTGTTFNYSNSVIQAVLGLPFNSAGIAAGATLKMFNKSLSDQTGGTGSGYDIDLGALWRPKDNLTLGISQQNTLPASMGGKIVWGTGVEEGVPFNTKFGLAFKPRKFLLLALDGDYAKNKPLVFHGGLEWNVREFLSLRGGLEQVPTSTTQSTLNYALGLGLMIKNINFDYAYYIDNVLAANSTHYFTLSIVPREVVKKVIIKAPAYKQMFKDVVKDYWARVAIEHLARKGIITGYPDETFRPTRSLSRAELCTLLIKAKKVPLAKVTGKTVFKDVKSSHWAARYIKTAANYKLVSGYPDGTFKPNKALSREEAMKILVLFDKKPLVEKVVFPYGDIPSGRWSTKYVSTAYSSGWLTFIKEKAFYPKKAFTRAEAAFVLYLTSFVQNLK